MKCRGGRRSVSTRPTMSPETYSLRFLCLCGESQRLHSASVGITTGRSLSSSRWISDLTSSLIDSMRASRRCSSSRLVSTIVSIRTTAVSMMTTVSSVNDMVRRSALAVNNDFALSFHRFDYSLLQSTCQVARPYRVYFNILAQLALYQNSSLSTHSDSKYHE